MPVTNYIWDVVSDNVLMEKDDDGETIARYLQEPKLYGEVISQERGGQTRYYNYDGEGNTCELTDENQNVTDTYEYSAFGKEIARTGTTENPFGYRGALGYYANPETNDIYVRARIYEPKIGRWLSVDPLGLQDGANCFVYVRMNPVLYDDPSGTQCLGPPPCLDPAPPSLMLICYYLNCEDLPDPCACCTEQVARIPPADIEFVRPARPFRRCRAKIICRPNCPNGLLAFTGPPIPDPNAPNNHFVIEICVSCRIAKRSLEAVIQHELVHFRRFCQGGQGIHTCQQCKVQEGKAYEESCNIAFPNDPVKRARCERCGEYLGCSYIKNCVQDETPPCTPADLGVFTK